MKKINFYRDFGDLSSNSVVSDIYKKRILNSNKKKRKRQPCKTKQLAIAEYNKYLDDEYFKANKNLISKSKLRKVLKYRKENK